RIARLMEARGIALLDCPVSGGPKGARAGTLTVIAAGPPAIRDRVRPWLEQIGRSVFEVGDQPGQGQLMKLVNNLINAANMATAFEALVLGLQEAEARDVPMWVHGSVEQLWRFGAQQGLGRADFTALIKVLEGWAGVEVRSRPPA
ncbi:MAG: NAD(P)-dependent oxidoreductase, partial [Rhodospirillales bacterium]|nr:NAD(P)-dependent oxidoreductase [Rhodospirillales bacterium]